MSLQLAGAQLDLGWVQLGTALLPVSLILLLGPMS